MALVDLSHLLTDNMPVYPGTPAPRFTSSASVETDEAADKLLVMSSHTGTHMDAPAHMIRQGMPLDRLPLDRFIGAARLINCSGIGEIDEQHLHGHKLAIAQCEFVIIRTGWSVYWDQQKYLNSYPVLTINAARWLASFNLKGIGVDTVSVDAIDSATFPVHHIFLERNILIIENLTNLDKIERDYFTLSCFPLKIHQADGSPVRAVAIID